MGGGGGLWEKQVFRVNISTFLKYCINNEKGSVLACELSNYKNNNSTQTEPLLYRLET